jgi:rhodanese-related sulfurtransferase
MKKWLPVLVFLIGIVVFGTLVDVTSIWKNSGVTPSINPVTSDMLDVHCQDINGEKFYEMMLTENVIILDVRTPEETAEEKIPGAAEIDYRNPSFESTIDALDRNRVFLIYCGSGNRSSKACKLMSNKGFHFTYNLEGGFPEWAEIASRQEQSH